MLLLGNSVDQHLCFRFTESTIPLFVKSKFQASRHPLWLGFVGPGWKHRRLVLSFYFILTYLQKLSINGDQEVIAELLAQGIKPSYPQETVGGDVVLPIKLKVQRI